MGEIRTLKQWLMALAGAPPALITMPLFRAPKALASLTDPLPASLLRYDGRSNADKKLKEDFVLVPREPTRAMLKAAAKAMLPERRPTQDRVSVSEKHRIRYKAMIAAAPGNGPSTARREDGSAQEG